MRMPVAKPAKRSAVLEAQQKQMKLVRFLRVFIIFIIFILFTVMIYSRTSETHIFENTAQLFNMSDANSFLASGSIHFPSLNNLISEVGQEGVLSNGMSFFNVGGRNSENNHKSIDEVWIMATSLLDRTKEGLNFVTDTKNPDEKSFMGWDKISNAEVHIMHKLTTYLELILSSTDNKQQLYDFVTQGQQCTPLQAAQQEVVMKYISMDICSEIEWYKVAQLAWPEARSFVDVGANKGYLGSLFVSLWGGNALNLAPVNVFNAATSLGTWKDSRNPAGYCKDGYSHGIPLSCPLDPTTKKSQRSIKTGACNIAHKDLRVVSIDGSSYLASSLNHIITTQTTKNPHNAGIMDGIIWKYVNYAVSDVNGMAHFTKQSKTQNAGFEGGSIRGTSTAAATGKRNIRRRQLLGEAVDSHRSSSSLDGDIDSGSRIWGVTSSSSDAHMNGNDSSHVGIDLSRGGKREEEEEGLQQQQQQQQQQRVLQETEEVRMTTIDSYLAENGIHRLDLLKIDTEGNDNKVLAGAMDAIANKLGMFTFEGGKGVVLSKTMLDKYNELGFSCYSTSRAGLFKWNSGCMKEQYMGNFKAKDKGNVFCVSRIRAPMVTLAYDILSFPLMIEQYEDTQPDKNNAANEKVFRQYLGSVENVGKITAGMMVPIYLNIKPFCQPWPSCAKLGS